MLSGRLPKPAPASAADGWWMLPPRMGRPASELPYRRGPHFSAKGTEAAFGAVAEKSRDYDGTCGA